MTLRKQPVLVTTKNRYSAYDSLHPMTLSSLFKAPCLIPFARVAIRRARAVKISQHPWPIDDIFANEQPVSGKKSLPPLSTNQYIQSNNFS